MSTLRGKPREIAARAEAAKERITELSAQLEEFHRASEEIRITRKTLLELPEPAPPAPPPRLPDHPAYQRIMAVFAAAGDAQAPQDRRFAKRDVCAVVVSDLYCCRVGGPGGFPDGRPTPVENAHRLSCGQCVHHGLP